MTEYEFKCVIQGEETKFAPGLPVMEVKTTYIPIKMTPTTLPTEKVTN